MKKFLSMLLVLAMLCTALALASCGDDTTDTSSQTASSEESVAPPTDAELLEAALNSLGAYITTVTDVFGLNDESLTSEYGTSELVLSIDTLTAMGESAFGDDPYKITGTMLASKDGNKLDAVLHAAGEEVKYTYYAMGDKEYILFPELYGESAFDYLAFSEQYGETFPVIGTANSLSATDVSDDLKAILLKDEYIAVSEDGKTFTVTLDKAALDALNEVLEPLMSTADTDSLGGMIDLGGTDESVEEPEADSAKLILTLTSETQAAVSYTAYEGETVVTEATVNASADNGTTTVTLTSAAYNGDETAITLTAVGNTATVEGEMDMDGTKLEIALEATKENNVCTFDGTLSVVIDMSGMLLTLPFEINGSLGVTNGTVSMGVSLSASLEGMMEIGISMAMDFTSGDVTVTLPFGESEVAEFDAEDFSVKMGEVYPGASELLGTSGTEEYYESVDYCNEDYSMLIRMYENGEAEFGFSGLTYEKTDGTIKFYKGDVTVYELPYTVDGDGNYTAFGVPCETIQGTVENDGFIVNFYCYNDLYLDIYLSDETKADIAFRHAIDPASEVFALLLPDGGSITYNLTASEDGTTLTFLGETLTMVDYGEF